MFFSDEILIQFRNAARDKMGDPDECWAWPGKSYFENKRPKYYGHLVSRLSCEALGGKPITKLKPFVLHSCEKRWCWNPDHLRPGTHEDNMLDRGRVQEARWV